MNSKEFKSLSPGLQLILAERQKMIAEHGYTVWFDRNVNGKGELLVAARCYLKNALDHNDTVSVPREWPWAPEHWEPHSFEGHAGRIRDMIRAGALLSAEYDRYTDSYSAYTTRAFNDTAVVSFGDDKKDMEIFSLKDAVRMIDIIRERGKEKKTNKDHRRLRAEAVMDTACAIRYALDLLLDRDEIVFPESVLSATDAIMANYREVIRTRKDDWTVSVYRPKTMGTLPVFGMSGFVDRQVERADFFAEYDPVNARGNLKPYNPDLGAWDAMTLCRVYASSRKIDIYFCQLLIRPFSAQALDTYSKLWSPWPPQRLERIWDSRKWDENHDFKRIYKYADEGALEKIMTRQNPDDLAEGDGMEDIHRNETA